LGDLAGFPVCFGGKIVNNTIHHQGDGRTHRFCEPSDQRAGTLGSKADMCSALAYVRFGPKADINHFSKWGGMPG
jgi:hypothetical protein